MNDSQAGWPEPIVRVQSLTESGISAIPARYIRALKDRPSKNSVLDNLDIPVIDIGGLYGGDKDQKSSILEEIAIACREWGFFQVVNHGVPPELMDQARQAWRRFFHSPMEFKQVYSNSPRTYEGYGSRLGVQKGATLDWSDYYFLHFRPPCLKDYNKWPALSVDFREVVDEYGNRLLQLCKQLLEALSLNLGLKEDALQAAFGGDDIGACVRVNFYPRCPQPDLTFGLSPHSDPGGMTLLLPDNHVAGLQVRKGSEWVTVKPVSHAFIVNIGDQIQILSNGNYKSVEHRVVVNSNDERLSLAFFYNPKSTIPIQPMKEMVTHERPALYSAMTFDEYRIYIRTKGPQGKSQVESLQSPR